MSAAPALDPGPLPACAEGLDPRCPVAGGCRFAVLPHGNAYATELSWTPVYDRAGRLLGSDPNTYNETVECWTCNRSWLRTRREVQAELVEITVPEG